MFLFDMWVKKFSMILLPEIPKLCTQNNMYNKLSWDTPSDPHDYVLLHRHFKTKKEIP